jgi:hypothetical protein
MCTEAHFHPKTDLWIVCCLSPPFGGVSTTPGKVTHVLLTRAPRYRDRSPFAFDLHVLGAPLTFALSQDQTLQFKSLAISSVLAYLREAERTFEPC